MKKIIFFLSLVYLMVAFCGCSLNGSIDETQQTTEESLSDKQAEPIKELSEYEKLQESSGYVDFEWYVYENDMEYTITYQRELLGGTYLLWVPFDIFESNGKIYVQMITLDDAVILIEITEDQCYEILSYDYLADIVLAFRVDAVSPISLAYYPWADYSHYDVWDDETGEHIGDFIDEFTIRAYIDMSSRCRLVTGTCVEIYLLEE